MNTLKGTRKTKSKFDKFFLLNGKKVLVIIGAFFLFVILHNLFYALSEISGINFGFFEALFFLIAIPIIPLYLIFSLIYTLIIIFQTKQYPKRIFYIKLIISIIAGLLITLILIYIEFLNEMYLIPFLAFSILSFGIISLFQKDKKN